MNDFFHKLRARTSIGGDWCDYQETEKKKFKEKTFVSAAKFGSSFLEDSFHLLSPIKTTNSAWCTHKYLVVVVAYFSFRYINNVR